MAETLLDPFTAATSGVTETGTTDDQRDLGQLVARQEVVAQGPGGHGQHHVVHRGAHAAFFRRLTSARLAAAKATRRRPVMATFNEVRGAVSGRRRLGLLALADPADAEHRLGGAHGGLGDLEREERP